MFKLIQNELIKIFKRPGTYVMIGLLVLIISIAGTFIKYQELQGSVPDNQSWKQGLQAENESLKKQLEELGGLPKEQLAHIERRIAINEYSIEHDISPNVDYSFLSFISDTSQFIEFAGLFTIIIAAGIVASEFSWGTVKLLLIRPIKRGKILLAKYITVVIFALLMLVILFGLSASLGAILFGVSDSHIPYLTYINGEVKEQSMIVHLILLYGLKSINMIMLATLAFMISAVFRNSSLAIGLSLFLMFTGGQITMFVAMKYDWAKYILFANTDLMAYFEGVPVVEGMTLGFSVSMLIIYFLIFQALAFYVFQKRDIGA